MSTYTFLSRFIIILFSLTISSILVWNVMNIKPVVQSLNLATPEFLKNTLTDNEILTIPRKNGFYYIDSLQKGPLFIRSEAKPIMTNSISLAHLAKNEHFDEFITIQGGIPFNKVNEQAKLNLTNNRPYHYGIKSPLIDSENFDVPEFFISVVNIGSSEECNFEIYISTNSKSGNLYLLGDFGLATNEIYFKQQGWLFFGNSKITNSDNHELFLGSRALSFTYQEHIKKPYANDLSLQCQPGNLTIRSWDLDIEHDENTTQRFAVYQNNSDKVKDIGFSKVTTLSSGQYQLNKNDYFEDHQLFEKALTHGLIRYENKQLQVAPMKLNTVVEGKAILQDLSWHSLVLNWDSNLATILKSLYWSENGRYVRQQVAIFNSKRLTGIAWRVKSSNMVTSTVTQGIYPINTTILKNTVGGEILTRELSMQWRPWQVAFSKNIEHPVSIEFIAAPNKILDVLLTTQQWQISEGHILHKPSQHCKDKHCLPSLSRLSVKTNSQGKVIIKAKLNQNQQLAKLYDKDSAHIRLKNNKPIWQRNTIVSKTNKPTTPFEITTRDGVVIYNTNQGNLLIDDSAYTSLIGIKGYRYNKLPSQITKRLIIDNSTDSLLSNEQYELTLDHNIHYGAHQLLSKHAKAQNAEFGSFIILNSKGEIIASPSYPSIDSASTNATQLIAKDYLDAGKSPIRFRPGYQDGSNKNKSGSVFKLYTAIAAAKFANQYPHSTVAKMFNGMFYDEYEANKMNRQYGFHPSASVYPLNAMNRGHDDIKSLKWLNQNPLPRKTIVGINNFRGISGRYEAPTDDRSFYNGNSKYGISEALRDSTNSYFGYLGELMEPGKPNADAHGVIDMLPLNINSLNIRPIYQVLNDMGFFTQINLTENLAPFGLMTTPAQIQHPHNVTQLYTTMIGSNNAVTPIQIAKLFYALATRHIVQPSLIKNSKPSTYRIELSNKQHQLIEQGLHQVVASGTAKCAFTYNAFSCRNPVKTFTQINNLHGKTGTEVWNKSNNKDHRTTVWMAGYLKSANGPLTFVCMLSGTDKNATGGKACGPLVRHILELDELKFSRQ